MPVPILPEGIKFETINIPGDDADFINKLKASDFIDWRIWMVDLVSKEIGASILFGDQVESKNLINTFGCSPILSAIKDLQKSISINKYITERKL